MLYRHFLKSNAFFSTQPQCCQRCLNFSWIELQMLLKCCLICTTVVILRTETNFYVVSLCSCLGLGLFLPFLCDLFFIFSLIFINYITIIKTIIINNYFLLLKQTYLFFVHFLEKKHCFWIITWVKKANNFQIVKILPHGVA